MKGRQQCLLPAFWGGMKEMCGSLYRDRKLAWKRNRKRTDVQRLKKKKKSWLLNLNFLNHRARD